MSDTFPFNFASYSDRLKQYARQSQFSWSIFGVVEEMPLYVLQRKAITEDAPHLYVSAGIHGDEPAGSMALLRMWQQKLFSPHVQWTIFPLLNPTGMVAGKRENYQQLDLNRDYGKCESLEVEHHISWLHNQSMASFDYALFLHEDWETTGAYLYCLDENQEKAQQVLARWSETIAIESATEIDGHEAKDGLIGGRVDFEEWNDRQDLPEAIYFMQKWAVRSLTCETPSTAYLADRVQCHVDAIDQVTKNLLAT